MFRALAVFLLLSIPLQGVRAVSPSHIHAIDKKALDIDKHLTQFTQTSKEDCGGDRCILTISFWGPDGALQKAVTQTSSERQPDTMTGRYYSQCRLILARVAPADHEEFKKLERVEKYYFKRGKLIQVTFGGEVKHFSRDQWDYYQRTQGVEPKDCLLPEAK